MDTNELQVKLRKYQEALMDMVNQNCRSRIHDGFVTNGAISAHEEAFWLLEEDGLIKHISLSEYELQYDKLTALTDGERE